MAELTTEALDRMIGISATDVVAGKAEAERIAKEQSEKQAQSEAVDKLAMQAEQAIQNIPSSYPGRSSLISDIQGAIASARSSARSGGSVDIAALRQLIAKAEETGKENTNRQASQNYLDATIHLSPAAQERINIASRSITSENLREYVDSIVDPDKEMDEQTRKRIADAFEAGVRQSPEAQAQLVIREHLSENTRRTVATMQEQGRADIEKLVEKAKSPQEAANAQRAKNSEINTTPEGLELVGEMNTRNVPVDEVRQRIEQIEEKKAQNAEAHRDEIFNAIPENRRRVLARMGLGNSAESLDLAELLHRNGSMARNADDFKQLREKGYDNLPADMQERLAVREAAKHTLMYSSLYDFNELAIFVMKSKGKEQNLTPEEQALIVKFDKLTDPATPQAEREDLAISMFKEKQPQLFKSVEKNPDFQRHAAAAVIKTIDENKDKFGVENNPHLVALEKAASDDVTARFAKAAASALDGAMAIISGDAAKAKEFANQFGEAVGSKDVGDALGSAGETLSGFFGPKFSAEIQQQLAGLDLSSLKDAQGNALAIKDAEGKVDMGKVAEALKERGISLKDVDVDTNGDITGQELLTALSKQKQTDQPQVS